MAIGFPEFLKTVRIVVDGTVQAVPYSLHSDGFFRVKYDTKHQAKHLTRYVSHWIYSELELPEFKEG